MSRAAARLALVAFVAAAALAIACGGGDEEAPPTAEPPTAPAPWTPAPGEGPRERGYTLVDALPGFTMPSLLGFAMLPGSDDEAIVLEQFGGMWKVSLSDPANVTPFADFSDLLIDEPDFEEGLLGLAFSPDFETDSLAYVYYTAGQPRRTVLARLPVVDGLLDTTQPQVLLEVGQPFQNHNGGKVAFGPDGYLYLGLGDGGYGGDPLEHGQDLGTLLGSIIRIDVSGDEGYEVPPDNPFVDTPGARGEIFAYGFRNPWRFNFDDVTGELWVGDVGQATWEEVERVDAGGNYGWAVMEGPACLVGGCDTTGYLPPRAFYAHNVTDCSVTGGYVYSGAAMPELDGYFIYGDFCSGNIWAVNIADDSPAVLLAETGHAITSWGRLPDGELVVTTFEDGIFQLTRAQ